MGIVVQSIVTEEESGLRGACITMVTHGLVSPGLFIITNNIYKNYGTRNINYISGISGEDPLIGVSAMWMIICNMGIPLSGNFVGEILCIMGIGEKNRGVQIWSSLSIIISGVYNMWLCVRVLKGKARIRNRHPNPGNEEKLNIVMLGWLSLVIGVYPEVINWDK